MVGGGVDVNSEAVAAERYLEGPDKLCPALRIMLCRRTTQSARVRDHSAAIGRL